MFIECCCGDPNCQAGIDVEGLQLMVETNKGVDQLIYLNKVAAAKLVCALIMQVAKEE